MKYYIKTFDGEIFVGKSERYYPGMIPFGAKLYNPYTKRTVIGWNNYKKSMSDSQRKYYGKVK